MKKLFCCILVAVFMISAVTSVMAVTNLEIVDTTDNNLSASAESDYTQPEEFIYGDVDFDTKVTVKDATLVQKYIAGLETLSLLQKQAAKINDSKITVRNATDIQKHIAEIDVNNSKVGKSEIVAEPVIFKNEVKFDTAATGDEIAFTQTAHVVWDTRSESWKYFASNRFYVFDKNHYTLNDLDDTKLENRYRYTDKYFEENALIVMSFGIESSSYMYRVDSITKTDGVLGVNYTLLFPKSGAVNADIANSRLYIEVDKADIEGITDIVTYKNVELY